MLPRSDLRLSLALLSPRLNQSPRQSLLREPSWRLATNAARCTLCSAIVLFALAFAAHAQQPYPGAPYYSGSPYPGGQYAPQYAQPQYAPQPYANQQPQYAPQYSAPQQPYAPQPYAPQPYSDQQPAGAQAPQYPEQDQAPLPAQALNAQNLEQLLAPIALYPDSLLAQILAASTYPAQVAVADQWLQQMRSAGYGSPDQIAAGANAQTTWDPSIKALTAFPDVLDMMNHNLEWTGNLGNAYYNQPQDVMQTVQVLRDRAEQAGNLQSTPQEEVQNDQGYVDLAPTNPQDVYVPTYDPWNVYGQPISPYPGFSFIGALGNFFGSTPIQYALSFALGAFDRMPFGWLAWGFDWLGHALLFNHSGYYTHSNTVADWGLPRGGPRAYYGRGGQNGMSGGQYRSYGERPGSNPGGYGERGGFSDSRGGRPSYGYTRPAMPAQQSYNRPPQDYSREANQQNYGYRPQTYPNHAPTYANPGYSARSQTYNNPGYRYGYPGPSNYGYSRQPSYAARPGFAYANPSQSYRAPQPDYSRGSSNRSYENYGNTVARNERSGGFHLFGGGSPKSYGGERAPKYSYKAPKSFGGGHQSFGGGHQSFGGGHMSAPRMNHSGGGGGHHHSR